MAAGIAVVVSAVLLSSTRSEVAGRPPVSSTEPSITGDKPSDSGRFSFSLGAAKEVPQCGILTGSGAVPRQGAAVLLVYQGGEFAQFGARLTFNGDRWQADAMVGTPEDAGEQFGLYILAATPETAEKIASRSNVSVVEMHGKVLEELVVTRTAEIGNC